jgi:hypothetical protein
MMRKLMLILIALIAVVTFIRSMDDVSLNAEENNIGRKATMPDMPLN